MKVLILTANTGEGHNQTTKALTDELTASGHVCHSVDSLGFLSEKKSKFLCGWHTRLYRHLPKIASIGYSMIDKDQRPLEKEGRWLYRFFAKGGDKLNKVIVSGGYDTVISVHPFATVIIAGFQQKYKDTKVKTAFVPTDYTCSPGAASGNIDVYFISHESLREMFIKRGIKNEKIVPTHGIPVGKEYFNAPTKAEAKKYLGIPENSKAVLLTCGSMGCGPIPKLTRKLLKALPSDVKLFVVCGKNKRLYKKLSRKKLPENVEIVGYTDKMLYYSSVADVYITKPGGISSTEAAVLGIPTLFVDTVGGCETYNCNFFVKLGSAKTAKKLNDFVKMTLQIIEGDDSLLKQAERVKKEFSQCSAVSIAQYYSNQKA